MPICHGSGGLAGQYRFGARSGASIIILGLVKFMLGLFVGNGIVPLLQRLPKSLLGIMVLAAGVELAKVGQTVNEGGDLWDQADENNADGQLAGKPQKSAEQRDRDRWMVMLITVAGCLAFKNDAVGFIAGLAWHWGLKSSEWYQRLRYGSIKLRRDDHTHQGEGLLSLRPGS
jgi:xanthine/uracil permease